MFRKRRIVTSVCVTVLLAGALVAMAVATRDSRRDSQAPQVFATRETLADLTAGTLALPEHLPPRVQSVSVSYVSDQLVAHFFAQNGPAVAVCAGELASCAAGAGSRDSLRTVIIRGRTTYVLRQPEEGKLGGRAITPTLRRYWETVAFTTSVPSYLARIVQ